MKAETLIVGDDKHAVFGTVVEMIDSSGATRRYYLKRDEENSYFFSTVASKDGETLSVIPEGYEVVAFGTSPVVRKIPDSYRV